MSSSSTCTGTTTLQPGETCICPINAPHGRLWNNTETNAREAQCTGAAQTITVQASGSSAGALVAIKCDVSDLTLTDSIAPCIVSNSG